MKVLVTAASKHGGTAEIADWIGAELAHHGVEAVVLQPNDVDTLEGYDAVVVGSAVYVGRWMEPATHLVERLQKQFRDRPVFLFSSGPAGDPPKPNSDPGDIETMRELTQALDHQVFPGRIARSEMGFGERVVITAQRVPDGDYRPRTEVESWARGIAERLTSTVATAPVPTAVATAPVPTAV